MKRTLLLGVALLIAVSTAGWAGDASPYIVSFKEGLNLSGFAEAVALPPGLQHLDRDVVGAVKFLEKKHGFGAERMYSHALRGFAAKLTPGQVGALKASSLVELVEPDVLMYANAQTLPWGIDKIDADISSTLAGNGSGSINVQVYVIDTGTSVHTDLNRAGFINFTGDGNNTDCNGHGTHVAGTVAAIDNTSGVVGVAPGAPITAVKVLGCNGSGYTSWIISGVDWVAGQAGNPKVANMSLGGGASTSLDNAVKAAVGKGVTFAIAAGNDGRDACRFSPARIGASTAGAIVVGATDSNDKPANWSNYGSCVDIWAPGVSILSTYLNNGLATGSGTSMASPHVAGAVALWFAGHAGSPAGAEAAIKAAAVSPGTKAKDRTLIKRLYVGTF